MKRSAALAAAAALTLAVAGCASANKTSGPTASAGGGSSVDMSGSSGAGASSSGSAGGVSGANSSMAGMSMKSGTTTVVSATGVRTPVPVRTIGSGTWKAMDVTAQEMTPVPFYIYNGSGKFSEVKPKGASFHLMVMLTDKQTGVAIPYATVWAEFFHNGKMVYNHVQYPMLARYMGPHYGDDVTLPGAGRYTLKLLVSAPVAAMHVEYNKMWVGTHTITTHFTWTPPSSRN